MKQRPLFEAIGGYGDYYAVNDKVFRVNFQSAEKTLCAKYETSDVRSAISHYPRAAYEFIRHFRKFIAMNPVEKQFAVLEAVRTSSQAADYFLKNQIEFRCNVIGFEKARCAAELRNEGKKS